MVEQLEFEFMKEVIPNHLILKNLPENKTILTIIQGELRNWGYDVGEITLDYEPNWGDAVLKMEVKTSGA